MGKGSRPSASLPLLKALDHFIDALFYEQKQSQQALERRQKSEQVRLNVILPISSFDHPKERRDQSRVQIDD